jgi:hypothetical protein
MYDDTCIVHYYACVLILLQHAPRSAHSTRRERMLSLLFRNNSSLSAQYVRVRPGTVAHHAPDVHNSFKVLDACHSLCRVSDVCVNDANTPPRPLPAQPAFKASLLFCRRRREKTKKTSRFLYNLNFILLSLPNNMHREGCSSSSSRSTSSMARVRSEP